MLSDVETVPLEPLTVVLWLYPVNSARTFSTTRLVHPSLKSERLVEHSHGEVVRFGLGS